MNLLFSSNEDLSLIKKKKKRDWPALAKTRGYRFLLIRRLRISNDSLMFKLLLPTI